MWDVKALRIVRILLGRRCDERPIEDVTHISPVGIIAIHQGIEARRVVRFIKVDELVREDVFEAFNGLFRQLKIDPDAAGSWIAAAPACFHVFDAIFVGADAAVCFAALDDGGHRFFQCSAIPLPHDRFKGGPIGFLGRHHDHCEAVDFDLFLSTAFKDVKRVGFPPEKMGFLISVGIFGVLRGRAHMLTHGLYFFVFLHNECLDRRNVRMLGSADADVAAGRVDAQVHVADGLPCDLDGKRSYDEILLFQRSHCHRGFRIPP